MLNPHWQFCVLPLWSYCSTSHLWYWNNLNRFQQVHVDWFSAERNLIITLFLTLFDTNGLFVINIFKTKYSWQLIFHNEIKREKEIQFKQKHFFPNNIHTPPKMYKHIIWYRYTASTVNELRITIRILCFIAV